VFKRSVRFSNIFIEDIIPKKIMRVEAVKSSHYKMLIDPNDRDKNPRSPSIGSCIIILCADQRSEQ
jgi:hypothetical protein